MANPDSLARSSLLARRLQLEAGKVKDRQDIYTTAAEQLNGWSKSSGTHILFYVCYFIFFVINMYDLFHSVRKVYSKSDSNWT
jgi:hypothetical protein